MWERRRGTYDDLNEACAEDDVANLVVPQREVEDDVDRVDDPGFNSS
jgi:hypothetical protein